MICFDTGLPLDWVAISAIATFLMTIATFWTLYNNSKQLDELKRQWEEEHEAKLVFSIVGTKDEFHLKIQNIGHSTANNVEIEINKSFIDKVLFKQIRDSLYNLKTKGLILHPNESIFYLITHKYTDNNNTINGETIEAEDNNKNLDNLIYEPIHITGKFNKKKHIDVEFTINNFISESIIYENEVVVELKKLNEIVIQLKKISDSIKK